MKDCKFNLVTKIVPCIVHTGLMVATLCVSLETLKRVKKTRHEMKKFERPLELLEAVKLLRDERRSNRRK